MWTKDIIKSVDETHLSSYELEGLYLTLQKRRLDFIGNVMKVLGQSRETYSASLMKSAISFVRLYVTNRQVISSLKAARPSGSRKSGRGNLDNKRSIR